MKTILVFFIVLIGLFIYWAASDIPLPKNAKKIGDNIYIDISEGATDRTERQEALFVVPESFDPKVFERGFAFYFKYPEATPYSGNESPVPIDSVRVVLTHHKKTTALPTEYVLRKIQTRDGLLKNVPYFVESIDGLEIYQYDYGRAGETTIGTYYRFVTADGNTVLVGDAGEWSHAYEIHGKLSSHIALLSMPSKKMVRGPKYFTEGVTAVDNAVLKLVKSFQSK